MLIVSPTSSDAASGGRAARPSQFQMPVFKPGVRVSVAGREETVSHIVLRRREMMVYLVGVNEPVKPERLRVTPTVFNTVRRPEVLNWYL